MAFSFHIHSTFHYINFFFFRFVTRKQNQESSDKSLKETEKSEVPSIEQHQSFMKDVSQNKIKAISGYDIYSR
jgi:hypothetical protein